MDYRGILGTELFVYQRSNLAISFDDTQPASDTLYFGNPGLLEFQQPFDVSIRIDRVIHDNVSDLEFTLTHLILSDTLIYRIQAGGGTNFINTVLNDELGFPFLNATAPFTGIFQPHNPLNNFLSVHVDGQWILTVTDHKQGDDGILDGWSLFISQSTIVTIDEHKNQISHGITLYQNYPNPFNPRTVISWQLADASHVKLDVYNVRGQKISSLINQLFAAGPHSICFDGTGLPSGVYFYYLQTDHFSDLKKMILLR
ncbi:T9SS C-terminal target domain-containing protein [bacterium]|nr:MAG: T9SS C-terminal target domain-containing protein [bacterium]